MIPNFFLAAPNGMYQAQALSPMRPIIATGPITYALYIIYVQGESALHSESTKRFDERYLITFD